MSAATSICKPLAKQKKPRGWCFAPNRHTQVDCTMVSEEKVVKVTAESSSSMQEEYKTTVVGSFKNVQKLPRVKRGAVAVMLQT